MNTLPPNVQQAYNILVQGGVTPLGAIGLLGNWQQESGPNLNPKAFNPRDPGGSVGVGQWNQERKAALKDFADKNDMNPDDVATQARFAVQELHGPENKALGLLNSASTPQQAAEAGLAYERPSGYNAKDPTGSDGYANRMNFTKGLLGGGLPAAQGGAATMTNMPTDPNTTPGQTLPSQVTPNVALASSPVVASAAPQAPPTALAGLLSSAGIDPNKLTGVAAPTTADKAMDQIGKGLSGASSGSGSDQFLSAVNTPDQQAMSSALAQQMQRQQMAQQLLSKFPRPAGLLG